VISSRFSKTGKSEIIGPYRVRPGGLSVSRTFGDAEAKFGPDGNPNVVIAVPDITSFKVTAAHDFIVLGCDGVFDKLSSEETIQCVWNSIEPTAKVHKKCGIGVETILKNALYRESLDNVTALIIALPSFADPLTEKLVKKERENKENEVRVITKTETRSPLKKAIEKRQFYYRKALDNLSNKNISYMY